MFHTDYKTEYVAADQQVDLQWAQPNYSHQAAGFRSMVDYYGTAGPEFYGQVYAPRYENGSTGTSSPHSVDNAIGWQQAKFDNFYAQLGCTAACPYPDEKPKKPGQSNKKERRRTVSINGAFSNLRDCIPNVPKDTKLSKIKTLRLACGYINHLMEVLNSEGQPVQEFKADLSRKTPCRADKRKSIEAEIAAAAERKARGRSGWPQSIWAQDLHAERQKELGVTSPDEPMSEELPTPPGDSDTSGDMM